MKVYLDTPVEILGETIKHTHKGLIHLVDHYTNCMSRARPDQMDDDARKHCQRIIDKYKFHITLYEKENGKSNTTGTEASA